ncbi:MAG: hypothetical protein ACO27F_13760, partial [Beijerinckiaceae bacterium]
MRSKEGLDLPPGYEVIALRERGDAFAHACAIAGQAGIACDSVLIGEELAAMSDSDLRQRIGTVSVCARIMPEQKLRLVEALKSAGE